MDRLPIHSKHLDASLRTAPRSATAPLSGSALGCFWKDENQKATALKPPFVSILDMFFSGIFGATLNTGPSSEVLVSRHVGFDVVHPPNVSVSVCLRLPHLRSVSKVWIGE